MKKRWPISLLVVGCVYVLVATIIHDWIKGHHAVDISHLSSIQLYSFRRIAELPQTIGPNGNDPLVYTQTYGDHFEGPHDQLPRPAMYSKLSTIPCGFNTPSDFDNILWREQNMTRSCDIAVVTAMFGAQDQNHLAMFDDDRVCYFAFMDILTVELFFTLEDLAVSLDGSIMYGKWEIIILPDPALDRRRAARIPKMLTHRLFPWAKYLLWLDGKMRLEAPPSLIVEKYLGDEYDFAIYRHHERDSIYTEGENAVKHKLDNADVVSQQLDLYRKDHYPEDNGLYEGRFFLKKNDGDVNRVMCAWFNEYMQYSQRDQLGLPYVMWSLEFENRMNPITNYGGREMCRDTDGFVAAKWHHHVLRHGAKEGFSPTWYNRLWLRICGLQVLPSALC